MVNKLSDKENADAFQALSQFKKANTWNWSMNIVSRYWQIEKVGLSEASPCPKLLVTYNALAYRYFVANSNWSDENKVSK